MFRTVLVANRGEIAVRVLRTVRELGLRSVAVCSDADRDSRHVREADVAVHIGPAPAALSYLNAERVIAAALETGAEAIHPGYGFLAENAAFAQACAAAGLVFVGPPVHAIEAMGDKIHAKQTMVAAGVPVVPGRSEPGMTDADLVLAAEQVGYPVLVKPSAGGGGKGMRLVSSPRDLPEALASARREALSSFGDDTLFVERFVLRPRHIELQVLADAHGQLVHLGERECSLQRRHQKVIEEAPSPMLSPALRETMGEAAVAAARAVGYTGVGTVEFIASSDAPDAFFFMEMNTRLQVEHPVTELVTGLDLVEWQLRVAAGERLTFSQQDVRLTGHAIEARIYAEDPARGFLPTGGQLLVVDEAAGLGVRVDSGIEAGMVVGSSYDPMLAKVIGYGPDRETALARLDRALSDTTIVGVGTNIAFLRRLIAQRDVVAGDLHTGLIEDHLEELVATEVTDEVVVVAALACARAEAGRPDVAGAWAQRSGWRIGTPAWETWRLQVGDRAAVVTLRGDQVCVDGGHPLTASVQLVGANLVATYGETSRSYVSVQNGAMLWLGCDGASWKVTSSPSADSAGGAAHQVHEGRLLSPMPGVVAAVLVSLGEAVTAGQSLVVVEAMKMEHAVTAPHDGVVTGLAARAGLTVAMDELLIEVSAAQA